MYQQPKLAYASTDSVRRLSSNNPFRLQESVVSPSRNSFYEQPRISTQSSGSLSNLGSFNDWVEKNRQLLETESDDEEEHRFVDMSRPLFPPKPVRADSDSSVNYSKL